MYKKIKRIVGIRLGNELLSFQLASRYKLGLVALQHRPNREHPK